MPEFVNNGLLRIARQRKGFSQGEASKRLGVPQVTLSRFENAISMPSDEFLKQAESIYELPVSFFQQADPVLGAPVSVHPMWRKKHSVTVREMDQIVADLNIRILHIRRMLEAVEFTPLTSIPKLDLDEYGGNIERIATTVRSHWLVPTGPFQNLTASIEQAGGIVVHSPLGESAVSGVTISAPGLPPIIILNQDQPADRMRYTLAHELGHIVMHRFPNPNMEHEANEFAGALLMPLNEIETALFGRIDLPKLAALKPEWKVSMQALLFRAQSRGIIASSQASYLWRQFNVNRIKMREPPELDFAPEVPGVLSRMIRLHLETFGYSIAEFAKILRLHEHQVVQYYDLNKAPEKPTAGLRLRIVQ